MLQKKIASRLFLTAILALASGHAARATEWDGLYAGVAGGAVFDKVKILGTSVGPGNVFGVDPSDDEAKHDDSGGRVGGFLGWQMQVAPDMVAGVEGDVFGLLTSKQTHTGLLGVTYGGVAPSDQFSQSSQYEGSVRARTGYLVEPDIMAYVTGGMAFRGTKVDSACPSGATSWCGAPESQSITKTLAGWTVGAGVETKLMDQWTIRLDYRYSGYGRTSTTWFGANNQGADQVGTRADLSSQAVTLGIAYHFGL